VFRYNAWRRESCPTEDDHQYQADEGGWPVKLPPDVEFHEDIRLFIYRPRGLLDEASVDRVVAVLGELETKLQEPFNRFSDTSETDQVELNYRYVIEVSLYRVISYGDRSPVKSAVLAADPASANATAGQGKKPNVFIPTLLAAAGEPNVKEELLNGKKVGDKTFKVRPTHEININTAVDARSL
jgi:hypothetical protein